MVLHLNKLESPSHKDALCQVCLKLAQRLWRWRFFLISSMHFRYFVVISPWKKAGAFIWTNLSPHHPWMLCAKFGWNWPSGAGEGDFLMYFRYFVIISPKNGLGRFIWTNHQRMHCVKFGWNWQMRFFRRRFLNLVIKFLLFRNYHPLRKSRGASFEQTYIPFTKGCIVSSLVEIGPVVLE